MTASIKPKANSAVLFPPGAKLTTMPRFVAASISTW